VKAPESIFKPRPTAEAKNDNTTRVAREIIDQEAAARLAKTNRLREARLVKEASEPPVEPKKTPVRAKAAKAPKTAKAARAARTKA